MNILVAAWDGGGTVPVELGVVRRLVRAGHRVRVLADPTLGGPVDAAGARFRPWTLAPARRSADDADDILKDWECRTPLGQFARVRDRIVTGPAAGYATDVTAELSREPADVLLADGVLLGALAAAEAASTRAVALCPNIYPRPAPGLPPFGLGLQPAAGALGRWRDRALNEFLLRMWRTGSAAFNAARAELGLGPLVDPFEQWDRCAAVAVFSATAFDFPARLPGNVHYVGPVLDDPSWAAGDGVADDGPAPRVVVGMSSTHVAGQRALLGRVARALVDLELDAVVTTGPTVSPADVPGSDRVRVVRSAPHSVLFEQADLVVTHAGHGTVIKALAAGVPVLGIPTGRDQHDNMARVTAHRVGARLPAAASCSRIAAQIQVLLGSTEVRARAQALGRAIRAEIDRADLEDVITSAAGTPRS